jgi:hypothetical protein
MLLEAYRFRKTAEIGLVASIVSYIGAGLFLLLSIFGFVHLLVAVPSEVFPKIATRVHAAPTA